ncbi:MAG: 4-hydroxyphenylacetate 3-hydroxylase family protein [Oscillospiraceae bacterium]|nr:4-hydroxyphenylacetate 3-hydroxylase family protein [Oscillospiraceae bacterium]
MKTGAEYMEALKQIHPVVYFKGEKIDCVVGHPLIQPHINAAATTYDMAHEIEHEDLLTATSHLTGEKISRFTHIHQSTDDLIKKVKMLRAISQRTGSCYQRCVGMDAINAAYSVTYEIDQKYGTEYHERFKNFLKYIQKEDLMVAGAMTDPKGDRGLSPSQQSDPDMYVHVVSKDDKGIVIRGAKMHMTGMVNSFEMLIMPTTSLKPEEGDYAVSCAIPVDAKGVVHIFGRQTNDERKFGKLDQGNVNYGVVGGECLTILDDVFVPWERVFMCGETDFSGMLVERFASYHRQNYGGCKGGVADVMIGATATLADYNGTAKAAHIKDKEVEMIHLTETLYACSLACSADGSKLPCGSYYVNPLLANASKQNVTRFIYEIARLSQDIAGGILATMPSEEDLNDPELGEYVKKYLKGVEGVSAEDRFKMLRLLENMTSGTALVESMHGAGSPQAQRVMLTRQANLEQKKKIAKRLAGIKEEPEGK